MPRSRRKVAIVTGGGRGIGFATAREFVDQRYAVVIAERIAPRGKSAARKLRDAGGDVLFVQVDVSKAGAGERAVRTAISKFGALGCLVNNAGVVEVDRLDKLSRRSIEKIVRVNLLGPLLVARAA